MECKINKKKIFKTDKYYIIRALLLSNKNKKLQHHFTVTMVTTQISRIKERKHVHNFRHFHNKMNINMTINSPLPLPKEMIVNEVL